MTSYTRAFYCKDGAFGDFGGFFSYPTLLNNRGQVLLSRLGPDGGVPLFPVARRLLSESGLLVRGGCAERSRPDRLRPQGQTRQPTGPERLVNRGSLGSTDQRTAESENTRIEMSVSNSAKLPTTARLTIAIALALLRPQIACRPEVS